MGFGGGGSGSFVLPNHTHTNVLADGGALSDLSSLVDAATMQVWFNTEYAATKPVISTQIDTFATTFTTTSGTLIDITGFSLTLPNRANGTSAIFVQCFFTNTVTNSTSLKIFDGGAGQTQYDIHPVGPNFRNVFPLPAYFSDLSGQIIKVQTRTSGGSTLSILGTTDVTASAISTLEIST